MISYETFCQLKDDHERQGLTVAQIAEARGLHRHTVTTWLAKPHYQRRHRCPRPSKRDPFKAEIIGWLQRHPLSATQVFQRLREQGYTGGYTILTDYIRHVRPRRPPAYLKLAFAPGECAQVDWGSYGTLAVGSTMRRLSFFVMVLCYSRLMYVEFTLSQTLEQFLTCHENAFRAFQGVPRMLIVDYVPGNIIDLMWPRPLCGGGRSR